MKREIVIEVEQIRRIRKRTTSQLRYCIECRRHTDFVSLHRAAQLFERDEEELIRFVRDTACHIQMEASDIHICLVAFLEAVSAARKNSGIKMIGDINQ